MEILAAGQLAPSDGNSQPAIFSSKRHRKAPAAYGCGSGSGTHRQAPLIIVVCVEPERSAKYGDIGRSYLCCWTHHATSEFAAGSPFLWFRVLLGRRLLAKRVKKALGLPRISGGLFNTGGQAAETPEQPPRRPLEEWYAGTRWRINLASFGQYRSEDVLFNIAGSQVCKTA
jgi:nitroreductase